jgi:hypothetical protein
MNTPAPRQPLALWGNPLPTKGTSFFPPTTRPTGASAAPQRSCEKFGLQTKGSRPLACEPVFSTGLRPTKGDENPVLEGGK